MMRFVLPAICILIGTQSLEIASAGEGQSLAQSTVGSSSPEAQRFAAQKKARGLGAWMVFEPSAKRAAEMNWHARRDASGKLRITKIRATINTEGQCAACKIVTASGDTENDAAIKQSVLSTRFQQPPAGVTSVDLFWMFMTDGTMQIVEFSETEEADNYNLALFGKKITPGGGFIGAPGTAQRRVDVDFGPYMADLQRRIKRKWFPPKGQETKRVVVAFKVNQTGAQSNLLVSKPSDSTDANEAALKAVRDASPFRPLPPGSQASVDIQFTFDYNVFNGGGSGRFTRGF